MNSSSHTPPMQPMEVDRRQLLSQVRRVVVKVGSSTISHNFALDGVRLDALVADLATVKQKRGKEVILVTSGAIATGVGYLGGMERPQTMPGLQAAAAVGQSRLMHAYDSRFQAYNQVTAMMLLTQEDFNDRKRYTHISNTLRTLLQLGVIPIINENDTVAVEEIKVGDNDTLAAHVTNLSEAGLLIILSDQPGFYTADPRKHAHAELISVVSSINHAMHQAAGNAGSVNGTGGMVTKLRAAEIVNRSGEIMVLASGKEPNVVNRILDGEEIGTLFLQQSRLSQRKRWIAYSRPPKGRLSVDKGAYYALVHGGKSLLPSGLRHVEGRFEYGDTVCCLDENDAEFARGLVNYDADEMVRIAGKRTYQIKDILGYHYYDEVIHRDNLVLMPKM